MRARNLEMNHHRSPKKMGALLPAGLFLLTLGLGVTTFLLDRVASQAWAGRVGSESSLDRHEGAPFHWTGALGRGKTVTIRGINGGIRAQAASGNDLVVDARKSGRDSDPDAVEVEAEETAAGVRVCARYPKPS